MYIKQFTKAETCVTASPQRTFHLISQNQVVSVLPLSALSAAVVRKGKKEREKERKMPMKRERREFPRTAGKELERCCCCLGCWKVVNPE